MNARHGAGQLPEHGESLWLLGVGPALWFAHFMASYVTAAVWCEKFATRAAALGGVRAAIIVYTLVALAGIAWAAWHGWQRHRYPGGSVPHDDDTPEDRHRFLGLATLLLSGLGFIATIYVALSVLFIGNCR